MPITVTVEQGDLKEVQSVGLFFMTDRLAVIRVETKSKRPKVMAIGATNVFLRDHIKIAFGNLPWKESHIYLWTVGRSYFDIVIGDETLEEEYINPPSKVIWSLPDTE